MRLDIPTIFVSGGPMAAGQTPAGQTIDLISVFEGVGAYQAGHISEAELKTLEDFGCPTCGSCSGLFTANSMNCLCEALGMALPGNGQYGIDEGLFCSMPVTIHDGEVEVVDGLALSETCRRFLDLSLEELRAERDVVRKFLP